MVFEKFAASFANTYKAKFSDSLGSSLNFWELKTEIKTFHKFAELLENSLNLYLLNLCAEEATYSYKRRSTTVKVAEIMINLRKFRESQNVLNSLLYFSTASIIPLKALRP